MPQFPSVQNQNGVVLRGCVDSTYINSVLKNTDLTLLKKSKWRIINCKWNQKQIKQFFDILYQSSICELSLQSNNHKHIIADISQVCFPSLLKLDLYNNNIESLQILSQADLPKLQELSINNNHISSIQSVRKLQNSSLRILAVNGNKITSMDTLCQANFMALTTLVVDWGHEISQGKSWQWIFKLQSPSLETIHLRSLDRIPLHSMMKMQKQKVSRLSAK